MPDLLAVGCYTPESGGRGAGISLVQRDPATGRLGAVVAVLPTPSPSFLTRADPTAGPAAGQQPGRRSRVLVHAAHELAEGLVSTWSLPSPGDGAPGDDVRGEQFASVPSGGGSPCHVAVHPSGRLLVVSDYDGAVGVIAARDGVATELVQALRPPRRPGGTVPVADRQRGPHPHSAVFLDAGHVVVADLGTDELRVHAVELRDGVPVRLDPEPVQVVRATPGCGPRTALLHGGRLHVSGELDATLLTADVVGNRLSALRSAGALAVADPDQPGQPSEVMPLAERLLLVATRGRDVLTVHAVDDEGDTRAVVDVPLAPAGPESPKSPDGPARPAARNPRHAVALGRHVYVSAQDSDLVLHLELAGLDGAGGADVRVVGHSAVSTGSPTVVLAL